MFTLQLRFNTLKRLFKSNALFSALEAQNSKAVTGLFIKTKTTITKLHSVKYGFRVLKNSSKTIFKQPFNNL